MRKTACPVVWEPWQVQLLSKPPDPQEFQKQAALGMRRKGKGATGISPAKALIFTSQGIICFTWSSIPHGSDQDVCRVKKPTLHLLQNESARHLLQQQISTLEAKAPANAPQNTPRQPEQIKPHPSHKNQTSRPSSNQIFSRSFIFFALWK